MGNINAGSLVVYKPKNELGLVKEVLLNDKVRVWYHKGGTSAVTPIKYLEYVDSEKVYGVTFANEYAKLSLLERKARMKDGGDLSDLIDNDCVREIIKLMYEFFKEG